MRAAEDVVADLAHVAPERQEAARKELAALGTAAVPALLSALDNGSAPRDEIAAALVAVGEPATEALETAARHRKPEVRASTAWALGNLGTERALDLLATLLNDPDAGVRRQAIQGLRRGAGHRLVPVLCAALQHADDWVRMQAAEALCPMRDPRAVPALCTAAVDGDPGVRRAAVIALGELGDPRAIEVLVRAKKSGDRRLRLAAAEALGKIPHPAAVQPLCEALLASDGQLQMRASAALVQLGATAAPGVCRMLGVQERMVLTTAVQLGAAAIPFLIEALRSREGNVRRAAAWALGELAEQQPHPELRTALPLLKPRRSFWRVQEEDLYQIYEVATERIERATAGLAELPLTADAPRTASEHLPRPASPPQAIPEGLPRPAAAPDAPDYD